MCPAKLFQVTSERKRKEIIYYKEWMRNFEIKYIDSFVSGWCENPED